MIAAFAVASALATQVAPSAADVVPERTFELATGASLGRSSVHAGREVLGFALDDTRVMHLGLRPLLARYFTTGRPEGGPPCVGGPPLGIPEA